MARNRNRTSRYFTPAVSIARRAEVLEQWEEWEEELFLSLLAEGKTYGQISQRLPGRTEDACRCRAAQKLRTQTMRKYQKRWEHWEDQIVLAHRKAGESYGTICKLLSHRTANAVYTRWNDVLKSRVETTITAPTATDFKRRWTLEEDRLLKSLCKSGQSWTEMAKNFPDCTATQCILHWYGMLHPPRSKTWKEWEERFLVSGYFAGLSWKEIGRSIPERTTRSAQRQWAQHFCFPKQDTPWTSEELTILTHLRAEGSAWDKIRQEIPRHSLKACRMQWYKETDGIQGCGHRRHNDSWSAEETDILIALYNTIGSRWEEICKHIPGRTALGCKSYFSRQCTKKDGVGDAPSKYWIDYFESKLHTRTINPAPISELTH